MKKKLVLVGASAGVTAKLDPLTASVAGKRKVTGAAIAANIGQPNPSAGIIEKYNDANSNKKAKPGPTPWTPEPWAVVNKVKPVIDRTFKGGMGKIIARELKGTFLPGFVGVNQTNQTLFDIAGTQVSALNHKNAVRKAARL